MTVSKEAEIQKNESTGKRKLTAGKLTKAFTKFAVMGFSAYAIKGAVTAGIAALGMSSILPGILMTGATLMVGALAVGAVFTTARAVMDYKKQKPALSPDTTFKSFVAGQKSHYSKLMLRTSVMSFIGASLFEGLGQTGAFDWAKDFLFGSDASVTPDADISSGAPDVDTSADTTTDTTANTDTSAPAVDQASTPTQAETTTSTDTAQDTALSDTDTDANASDNNAPQSVSADADADANTDAHVSTQTQTQVQTQAQTGNGTQVQHQTQMQSAGEHHAVQHQTQTQVQSGGDHQVQSQSQTQVQSNGHGQTQVQSQSQMQTGGGTQVQMQSQSQSIGSSGYVIQYDVPSELVQTPEVSIESAPLVTAELNQMELDKLTSLNEQFDSVIGSPAGDSASGISTDELIINSDPIEPSSTVLEDIKIDLPEISDMHEELHIGDIIADDLPANIEAGEPHLEIGAAAQIDQNIISAPDLDVPVVETSPTATTLADVPAIEVPEIDAAPQPDVNTAWQDQNGIWQLNAADPYLEPGETIEFAKEISYTDLDGSVVTEKINTIMIGNSSNVTVPIQQAFEQATGSAERGFAMIEQAQGEVQMQAPTPAPAVSVAPNVQVTSASYSF